MVAYGDVREFIQYYYFTITSLLLLHYTNSLRTIKITFVFFLINQNMKFRKYIKRRIISCLLPKTSGKTSKISEWATKSKRGRRTRYAVCSMGQLGSSDVTLRRAEVEVTLAAAAEQEPVPL